MYYHFGLVGALSSRTFFLVLLLQFHSSEWPSLIVLSLLLAEYRIDDLYYWPLYPSNASTVRLFLFVYSISVQFKKSLVFLLRLSQDNEFVIQLE